MARRRVPGIPNKPKPPHRMVLLLLMSSMAAAADGYTLSIADGKPVEEMNRKAGIFYPSSSNFGAETWMHNNLVKASTVLDLRRVMFLD